MNSNIIHATDSQEHNDETFGEIVSDGFFATKVAEEMKKSDESMTDEIVNNIFSNAQKILDIRKLEFWKCCLQLVSWTVFNLKGISHEISSDFFIL